MLRNFKVILVVLVVLVLAGGAYAFAAGNTDTPLSAAGYSAKTVAGYAVTDLKYNLKSGDPTLVDTITFKVEGAVLADTVQLQTSLLEGKTDWKDCTIGAATDLVQPITCTYTTGTPLLIADVSQTNIVASSNTK